MLNFFTHVSDVAWREASIVTTPELEEKRLSLISRNPNPIKRIGAYGLHIAAHYVSNPVIRLLSMPYETRGMSYVGSGWNSTVVKRGPEAIKIIRTTELMNPEERTAKIEELRRLIGYNAACHPYTTVESTVDEISHPVSGNPVVAIIQPHVVGIDALTGAITPDIKKQLQSFAEKSLDEMVPNGVAPDLVGAGNILVCTDNDKPGICLVDTVALEDLRIPHAAFPNSVKKLEALARP